MPGDKISTVRGHARKLQSLSDHQLTGFGDSLREEFLRCENSSSEREIYSSVFAFADECLRRTINISLYDCQILAADALVRGKIAEMATGEGKTFAAAPAAIVGALKGESVHVGTTNEYLAKRDFELLKPAFDLAGVSASLLPDFSQGNLLKEKAYQCEVVYGTGYEFGFDYLRDSLTKRNEQNRPLGKALLERLTGDRNTQSMVLQKMHQRCIIDEADNVLIDEACSPLILSGQNDGPASDSDACNLATTLAETLEKEKHFRLPKELQVILTDAGREFVHSQEVSIPIDQLRRPWTEYIQQALSALYFFQRDTHYVVQDQKIQIVDSSTGRIFPDRAWSDGLHQAIEAKEQLPISNERVALAQITRQKFYRLYQTLGGMTGTATGCEKELKDVYWTDVEKIPTRLPCRRETLETKVFADHESKLQAMDHEVRQMHQNGRPVLIGTRTITESEQISDLLSRSGLPFQLLNGKQDADEAELISHAGRPGAIMIATNLAGRGTDIKLTLESRQAGGLHVIVSAPHDLYRIDRQLIGRSGRQGDPGSARTFLSADDSLLTQHAPWLSKAILRDSNANGEAGFDAGLEIRKVQQSVERTQAIARSEMLKKDLERDKLLSGDG